MRALLLQHSTGSEAYQLSSSSKAARTEEAVTKCGLELDGSISGPQELLLKFEEENYPLPEKPESLPEEESVKELQRKRHLASPERSHLQQSESFEDMPNSQIRKLLQRTA